MNKTLVNILKSREDLSDYLFHFTKGSNAIDVLESITQDKSLKDNNGKGVICLTEAPLLSLVNMFKIFESYSEPLYAPYGIAIKKDFIYGLGGRNVIYGLPTEKVLLDESIRWRFEKHVPNESDFTWLREWRIPVDKIDLDFDNCFVITKTKNELFSFMFNEDKLIDVEIDGCVADGQFLGTAYGTVERSFKGVSIEDLTELNEMTKNEIEKIITEQGIDDTGTVGLGSVLW
jgi:hypothetical protein